MRVELHVERDDLDDLDRTQVERLGEPERLAAPGRGMDRAHFVDPVSVIVAVSVSVLAERIVGHWLRGREKGVQVDLTTDPPQVSNLAGVPRGYVVAISSDGVETLKLDYDDEGTLADTLVELLGGRADSRGRGPSGPAPQAPRAGNAQ